MFKLNHTLSLLICLVAVATLIGCASTRTQRGTGEFIDDSVITTKVKAAFFNEPTLKSFQIEVQTFKGEVQLSGFVDSAKSVKTAGTVAQGVEGVKSVKNDLIVK